jgi:general L-amino acid transport system substrate-binding protein
LASGEIDMLARNTTWTMSRDVDLKFEFIGVNYYDGQGFMVKASTGITSAKSPDIDGVTVCIQTGTTTELNLADHFRSIGMSYEPLPVESGAEAVTQYMAGACDMFTTDRSALAARRANMETPEDHVLLPEIISKEPLGPLVRHGDNDWADVVRWTLNALNRLLGSEGNLGEMLNLDADWAKRAISVAGNYGEIFEANIGSGTIIGLARGVNAMWTDGGLIYSPPFR